MISLSKLAHDHMLVVFFVYGLAFFLLGTAILLKQDKRSTLKLRSLLLLLAGFGLLHGASEWSDMFLALGETYLDAVSFSNYQDDWLLPWFGFFCLSSGLWS